MCYSFDPFKDNRTSFPDVLNRVQSQKRFRALEGEA